jgi:hypothetical protein
MGDAAGDSAVLRYEHRLRSHRVQGLPAAVNDYGSWLGTQASYCEI